MNQKKTSVGIFSRVAIMLLNLYKDFQEDKCFIHAGHLAYISILSLVPMLVVGVSLFSVYGISPAMKTAILDVFLKHMLPGTAQSAFQYIDKFVSKAGSFGLPGMAALIFLSYSLFNAIQGVFQGIWKVKKRRSFVRNILIFTNVLFWTPLLMGISIYLKGRLEFMYQGNVASETILTLVAFLLPLAGFTVVYLIIPAVQVRLRSAALGGGIASILWYMLLHGFDLYVKYTQSMQALSKLYGSLVIIPVFLVWVYFCWVITFVGAEVAFYHQFPRSGAGNAGKGDFFTALAILRFVASRFKKGNGPVSEAEITGRWPAARVVLERLVKAGILADSENGYLPAKPPDKIRLADLLVMYTSRGDIGGVYDILWEEMDGATLEDSYVEG